MSKIKIIPIGLSLFMMIFLSSFSTISSSFSTISSSPHSFSGDEYISSLYQTFDFQNYERPDKELFQRALIGYNQLYQTQRLKKNILTVIDFRKSGNEKRLWVLDLKNKKVLYHSLVAHGRNSGDVYASKFSNIPNSNQSSLGFYVTGNTYVGKHGVSLILHGVEKGINDNAEKRAIVMHGADYVSESYINRVGRLGRSFGCPAVPMNIYKEIINDLAGGSCLFIYYPDQNYLSKTTFKSNSTQEEIIARGENPNQQEPLDPNYKYRP